MKRVMLSLVILLTLTGCWNYNELNNYSIATGMAIDITEGNKYMVSFLISNGKKTESESKNAQYQSVLYSGEGNTIYEAIKNIGLISPKQLYIGHLTSIVVSEEVAKKGLYDSLEFLLEDSQSKKNFYVVLAKDCMAKDLLSITTPMTDFSSESISDNVASSHRLQGSIIAKTYNDIIFDLINDGIDTTISSFVIVGNIQKGSTLDNLESVSPETYIKLDNLGIFKGDKLVAWADKDISRGINIINNNVTELYLNLDCEDGHIVINITDLKTKKQVS
ncbi:MAG: Ger(x)C family spore germination protein [Bacilli bacterium]|nr:Ger(x)C family spore germination protein [Bacilli bacterium]